MLKESGHISPFAVIQPDDGSLDYVDLPDDKGLWRTFLTLLLWHEGAQRYFVVSEAWVCTLPRGGPRSQQEIAGVPVRENPLRHEALLVVAVERTGNCVFVEQQFAHDPKGIKLFKPLCLTGATPITFPTTWGAEKTRREMKREKGIPQRGSALIVE